MRKNSKSRPKNRKTGTKPTRSHTDFSGSMAANSESVLRTIAHSEGKVQVGTAPYFEGEVQTQWLTTDEPNRQMKLLSEFAFVDQKGTRWEANVGDVIDGASIPQFLWTLVGSPFIGDYRRASVLHDVACDQKTRPSKDVHRMFYEAMRADNVPEDQALEFYTAVRLFGPHWEVTVKGAVKIFSARTKVRPGVTFKEVESALDTILAE
jgi:hypothetical protein